MKPLDTARSARAVTRNASGPAARLESSAVIRGAGAPRLAAFSEFGVYGFNSNLPRGLPRFEIAMRLRRIAPVRILLDAQLQPALREPFEQIAGAPPQFGSDR